MRIDYRTIRKRTGCSEEQAKQLANDIRKLPKIQKNFHESYGRNQFTKLYKS